MILCGQRLVFLRVMFSPEPPIPSIPRSGIAARTSTCCSVRTFNLSSGILIEAKNNVTLRGSGPDQTKLIINATVGCVFTADICVKGASSIWGSTLDTRVETSWTGGYAKGSTAHRGL